MPAPAPPPVGAPPSLQRPRRGLRRLLAGHGAALLAVLVIAGLFLRSTHQLAQTSQRVTHTLDVIHEADQLLALVTDAETSQRGYLLLQQDSYRLAYEEARERVGTSVERLRALTRDDARQRARVDGMEALVQRRFERLERAITLIREGQSATALETMRSGQGQQLMAELRALERALDEQERRTLEEQNTQFALASWRADVLVLAGSGFLLVFIGFAASVAVRNIRALERERLEREALMAREQAVLVAAEGERQRLRYQSVFMQVPAAVGVYRASDQRCELANPALQRMHGGRALLGLTAREAHPEHASDPLFSTFDEVFRTGRPYTGHALSLPLGRDAQGHLQEGYFNFTYQPLLDARGQVEAVLLFAVDVTEQEKARQLAEESLAYRERAEGFLRESEERFRLLAETLPHLIWTTRADGAVEYFNPRWFEYTGQTQAQALGQGWLDALHPEDRPRTHEAWARACATGEPYTIEYRLRRGTDGAYRWFIARGLALREASGAITAWFGTSTDVDDQKRTTETLRFLSDTSVTLAASLEHAETLRQVARLAVPVLADWCIVDMVRLDGGMERVEVAHAEPALAELARRLRHYPPGPGHPSVQAAHASASVHLAELDARFEERVTQDAEHLGAALQMRMRSLVSVPLLARGRTLGVLTFITTESSGRRFEPGDVLRLEQVAHRAALAIDNARLFSLAQAERTRAEEANRLKDEFLATVSHELRTPLTAMIGWLGLLRSGRVPEHKQARALETVDRNAHAQAQLIEDLLDVSRIISGKLRLETHPVHLGDIIQAALESVRPAAEAKAIRLESQVDTPEDGVMGDAGRLQQVVWNLLSNAVKFSPGERRVRVRLARVEGLAELTVEDEGPGVPADFLPHIFERFRQLDGGTTRRHGGLGLGLAIVRHLVELHGGTVQAASEGPGRGATFTVRLPFAGARLPAPEPAASRRLPPPPTTAPRPGPALLDGHHRLVVDDEEDGREVLKALLETWGARVTAAPSAAEALRVLREQRPGLLISDIGMPGEDGYALISRVRALPLAEGGGVPAVALTAYARVEDRTRALTAGFDTHVSKPVDPSELQSVLGQLLRREHVERE